MEKVEAYELLSRFVLASSNKEVFQALQVLVERDEPLPPQPLGALWNEATLLADLIRKTGVAEGWQTPGLRTKGMERLLHRFVCLLERFTVVLGEALPGKGMSHIQATRHYLSLITVDPTAEGE